MPQLKKIVSKHKFQRIQNNPKAYYCKCVRLKSGEGLVFGLGYLLDNHLYIWDCKLTGTEYYRYFVGDNDYGTHDRKDHIMYYKYLPASAF